jgi:heme-degrading monooxygenase HmoA
MAAPIPGGTSPALIIRVLTARVRPGRVGLFNMAMRRQLAIMREQPGLVYVKLARRLDADGGQEVVLFEEWRDPDSVYGWAGEDLSRPRLLPAAAEAAETVSVMHYEGLEIGLEEEPTEVGARANAGPGADGPTHGPARGARGGDERREAVASSEGRNGGGGGGAPGKPTGKSSESRRTAS